MSKVIGDLALDTNAVIAYMRNDANAVKWIETATGLFLPVACVGELEYGALHSRNPKKHLPQLEVFLEQITILDITRKSASHYAILRETLAQKGKPIPEADLWIAAVCLETGLVDFLSSDSHFDEVPTLRRHDWKKPFPKKPQKQ